MLLRLSDLRLRLLITSFAILYFELICIRWTPSYIRSLIFFPNFILIASFLGIGIGVLMARRQIRLMPYFPIMLAVFIVLVAAFRFDLTIESPESLYFGSVAGGRNEGEPYFLVPLFFLFIVGLFIPLAQEMGRSFARLRPLQAYLFDIVGSLLGIALFTANSFLGLTPPVWFVILAVAILYILLTDRDRDIPPELDGPAPSIVQRSRRWGLVSAGILVAVVATVGVMAASAYWSPYYKITTHRASDGSWEVNVNNVGMQWLADVDEREPFYHVPYWLFGDGSFQRALVVGAGTGTDTAAAFRHGVSHVDAVEIDPVLLQLGHTLNPDRPYDDPRVRLHVDDARSYFRSDNGKYDLIVFGLPDSLTLTSGFANLRLESFLFTVESFQSARSHLDDNGLLVLYNYYREEWLVDKLAGMLRQAFGTDPLVISYGGSGKAAVLMVGPRLSEINVESRLPDVLTRGEGHLEVDQAGWQTATVTPPPATDDWPFLYIPDRPLPLVYVIAILIVGVFAVGLTRLAAPPGTLRRFQPHFFCLGAAFLLLETKSIVSFSLLFGSTWTVNSLVFFAIMVMVLLAIIVNRVVQIPSVAPLFVALFGALALAYFLPPEQLLVPNPLLRYTLASLLVFSPIFLANVIFARLFKESTTPDVDFAWNLLGAVFGGLLEYLSLSLGYQFLIILVALLYALAFGLGSLRTTQSSAELGETRAAM